MTGIDITPGSRDERVTRVDLHEIRDSLKLVRDSGTSAYYENRGGALCPVCNSTFEEVLETTAPTKRVAPSKPLSFCIVNDNDRVLLFTHA